MRYQIVRICRGLSLLKHQCYESPLQKHPKFLLLYLWQVFPQITTEKHNRIVKESVQRMRRILDGESGQALDSWPQLHSLPSKYPWFQEWREKSAIQCPSNMERNSGDLMIDGLIIILLGLHNDNFTCTWGVLDRRTWGWTWGRRRYRWGYRARFIIIFTILIQKRELMFKDELNNWIHESTRELLLSQQLAFEPCQIS